MRKTTTYIIALALLASFNANAVIVDTTLVDKQQDMDELDPIIAYTSLDNSGDATQIAWMNETLEIIYGPGGFDPIESITKVEFEDDAAVDAFWGDPVGTDSAPLPMGGGGDIHNGILEFDPDHYLIKIGEGHVTYDTFLYKNVGDLFLATIGLGWLEYFSEFDGNNFDVYRISHISAVPVPAAFWLFGTALIGLIGFTKSRKAA